MQRCPLTATTAAKQSLLRKERIPVYALLIGSTIWKPIS